MAKYEVGDQVLKPKGYSFTGEVRSVFTKRDGQIRLVVENYDGMLHIFNEGQIEHNAPEG